MTVSVAEAVANLPAASITVMVTVKFPAAVGVQVINGELLALQPDGSPDQLYENGATPPETLTLSVIEFPRETGLGEIRNDDMEGPTPLTVSTRVREAVLPWESVTVKVTSYVPAVVGVQESTEALLDEQPGGNPP
jgi:hypothetical protein